MSGMDRPAGIDFEAVFERRLRAYARIDTPVVDAEAVARDARRLGTRRGRGPWTRPHTLVGTRRATVLAFVVLSALVALTVAVSITAQRPSPRLGPVLGRNGVIGYVADVQPSGLGQVHLMGPDGQGDRVVGSGFWLRFSADGSTMAYRTRSGRQRQLVAGGIDGSGTRSVEGFDTAGTDFILAPEGRSVLVAMDEGDGSTALWSIQVADGAAQRVVPAPFDSYWAMKSGAMSPDGAWFAYPVTSGDLDRWDALQSLAPYMTGVDVVRIATGEVRHLASLVGQPSPLAWAPDGRSVSVVAWIDQVAEPMPESLSAGSYRHDDALYAVDIEGATVRTLSTAEPPCGQMAWAPAGDAIACLVDTDEGVAVAVIPIDAAGQAGPPTLGPLANEAVWAPDGSGLLIVSQRSTMRPDGGERVVSMIQRVDRALVEEPRTIATIEGGIDSLSWQWLAP